MTGSRAIWRRPAFWITIAVFVVAVELRWGPFAPLSEQRDALSDGGDDGIGPPTPEELARLRAARDADPSDVAAAFELARAVSALPDGAAEAEGLAREILERAPAHHEARLLLADLLLERGQPDEAARELEAALQGAPLGVDWRKDAEALLLEAHAAARAARDND